MDSLGLRLVDNNRKLEIGRNGTYFIYSQVWYLFNIVFWVILRSRKFKKGRLRIKWIFWRALFHREIVAVLLRFVLVKHLSWSLFQKVQSVEYGQSALEPNPKFDGRIFLMDMTNEVRPKIFRFVSIRINKNLFFYQKFRSAFFLTNFHETCRNCELFSKSIWHNFFRIFHQLFRDDKSIFIFPIQGVKGTT